MPGPLLINFSIQLCNITGTSVKYLTHFFIINKILPNKQSKYNSYNFVTSAAQEIFFGLYKNLKAATNSIIYKFKFIVLFIKNPQHCQDLLYLRVAVKTEETTNYKLDLTVL